jgi:hypothetical protein
MKMSIEILLLGIACSMTLLAYMIAINAHGTTRLSLSYFLATLMLAGNVWGVIHYVNVGQNNHKMQEMKRLEAENRLAEEKILEQQKSLKNKEKEIGMIALFNPIISTGTELASSMINANFQDEALEVNALIGRAIECRKKVEKLKEDYQNIQFSDSFLPNARQEVDSALQLLVEAAQTYRNYYSSEDPHQELSRERLVRKKAKQAYQKFKTASDLVSALKN